MNKFLMTAAIVLVATCAEAKGNNVGPKEPPAEPPTVSEPPSREPRSEKSEPSPSREPSGDHVQHGWTCPEIGACRRSAAPFTSPRPITNQNYGGKL